VHRASVEPGFNPLHIGAFSIPKKNLALKQRKEGHLDEFKQSMVEVFCIAMMLLKMLKLILAEVVELRKRRK
jgi:hypothetical protein